MRFIWEWKLSHVWIWIDGNNRDTSSTKNLRCLMHVCEIIIPWRKKRGRKKIELNWCYWYFLAWYFLWRFRFHKDFLLGSSERRQKLEKYFFSFQTSWGWILRRRSRKHGWRNLLFSMLNETLIIVKQNFLIHKVVSFR